MESMCTLGWLVGNVIYNVTGNFDLHVCMGSWHSNLGASAARGALALYIAPQGYDASQSSSFTEKAYGNQGSVSDQSAPFEYRYNIPGIIDWECPTCLSPSILHGSGYSEAQVQAAGFRFGSGGSNYFYIDSSYLYPYLPSDASQNIYMHQCATLHDVECPAK